MSKLVLAAAVLLAVLVAPSVAAAAPAQSAQRFVDAAVRGRAAVETQQTEIARRTRAAVQEITTCDDEVLGGAHSAEVARRIELHAGAVVWLAVLRPSVELRLPALRDVVSALNAVPTRDRALRAGRAAWRTGVRRLESLPVLAESPCALLTRWRDAGFTAASVPISRAAARRVMRTLSASARRDRRFTRAVRRLRAMGVSPRQARAFDGRVLLSAFPATP